MTKKHYIAFANAMSEARPSQHSRSEYRGWAECARAVVKVLQNDNPRFDGEKFLLALDEG